jgi:hypothetical protein
VTTLRFKFCLRRDELLVILVSIAADNPFSSLTSLMSPAFKLYVLLLCPVNSWPNSIGFLYCSILFESSGAFGLLECCRYLSCSLAI